MEGQFELSVSRSVSVQDGPTKCSDALEKDVFIQIVKEVGQTSPMNMHTAFDPFHHREERDHEDENDGSKKMIL